jgi:hypothetical protein
MWNIIAPWIRSMGPPLNRSRTALLQEHDLAKYNSSEDIERVVGWAQAELDVLSLKRAAIAMRVRVIKNTIVGLADVFGSTLTDEELRTLPPTLPVRRTARSFLSGTYTSMSSDVDGVFDATYNSRAVLQDRRNTS